MVTVWPVDSAVNSVMVIGRSQHRVGRYWQAELGSAEHGQCALGVVDRVDPARVSVAPESLNRRSGLQRPAAGVLEQPVHRANGLPGAAHLIAADPQPQTDRD